MQGHGTSGRFGGLPDEFANEQSKVVLLPVPFDLTSTYQKGSDLGPAALIEASRHLELYDIETNSEVYQMGIYTADPIEEPTSEMMLKRLYERVSELLKRDKFVVTLGGEHSVSQAPIRAFAEKYPGLSVLQLDAHADLQAAYEGNPLSHASVMARVHEIPDITDIQAVGIRSMSAEELPLLNRQNTFFAHEICSHDDWMDGLLDNLEDHVYITFDLDVLDPAIMPSTGTPEPGGMDWYKTLKLLRKVAENKTIVGCDFVELCPHPHNKAPDFLAAKLVYKLLSYIFGARS